VVPCVIWNEVQLYGTRLKLATGIESKILGEKYDRFITENYKGEPCVKPQFKITDTTSFRYSSVAPNGQQIPSKGGFTAGGAEYSFPKLTRALFTASTGCVFGKIDYGQIEYRLICNIACGESGEEVRRQYRENPHMDFHQYVVDLTGLSRKHAKSMSFGVSFGMGLPSMAENFGWTMEKAEEISEAYHRHMPFVAPTLALVGDVAKRRGYIKTAYGSHARLPDPKKSYTMLNRYTQGSGAECLKLAITQAYREGVWKTLRVANTVHDELNMPYLEPTEEHMRALYRMAEIMRTAMPGLRVPLEAEIELGDDWAETKEIKDWVKMRENDREAWEKTSPQLKQAVSICERLIKEGRVQSA
jgi:DNA polymerase I-like protein with 3'-5' exonuclease and polymerase domains